MRSIVDRNVVMRGMTVCVYTHTHTHTHTHTYIYIYTHIYIHTHTHTHTRSHFRGISNNYNSKALQHSEAYFAIRNCFTAHKKKLWSKRVKT